MGAQKLYKYEASPVRDRSESRASSDNSSIIFSRSSKTKNSHHTYNYNVKDHKPFLISDRFCYYLNYIFWYFEIPKLFELICWISGNVYRSVVKKRRLFQACNFKSGEIIRDLALRLQFVSTERYVNLIHAVAPSLMQI